MHNVKQYKGYETPQYSILKIDLYHGNKIEIRSYLPFKTIATQLCGSNSELNGSFNNLFNYISGNNHSNAKISMTVPVFVTEENEARYMHFTVPNVFEAETPQPQNPILKINSWPSLSMAAIQFSGFNYEGNFNKHGKLLRQYLVENNIEPEPSVAIIRASYNSPFSLPFLRRNETLLPIKIAPQKNQ